MDPNLYKAARNGDVRRLSGIYGRYITEEGAMRIRGYGRFLKRTQHGNNNILHIAARAGRDTFVAEALRHFPFLSDQVNSQGDTPLLVAARFGHLQVVKTFKDPNNELPMQDDKAAAVERGTNSRSSLRQSGPLDDQLEHATAVENGTNWRDMATALENETNSSSSRRQRDAEEVLVDRQLIHGTTALHEALRNGHEEVAQYLLSLDPKMATSVNGVGESPLFLAAESRCESFMLDILQSNCSYSTKGPDGLNVLHAARDCPVKIIYILIRRKPDLMRQRDDHGKAAIHYAVEANYSVLVRQILKADASIALFPDKDGHTPLLGAVSSGHKYLCKKILEICPESIESRNHKGQHALHLGKLRVVRFLMRIPEISELLNEGDEEGNTSLHLAIKENDYEKAMLLASSNSIYLGAVNKEGLTAMDLCCQTDWKNLHKQKLMWFYLTTRGAAHGRRPIKYRVPVGESIADLKPLINTIAVVATIIATVTFAAAFTMPGGYDTSPDNLGVANLTKKAALTAFILSDTIALCCSITAVSALQMAVNAGQVTQWRICMMSWVLVGVAMRGTLVAFMCGIFVVIAPKALWVAILVCIICGTCSLAVELSLPFLSSPSIIDIFRYMKELIRKISKQRGVVEQYDLLKDELESGKTNTCFNSFFGSLQVEE